jgi:hypothetical protein
MPVTASLARDRATQPESLGTTRYPWAERGQGIARLGVALTLGSHRKGSSAVSPRAFRQPLRCDATDFRPLAPMLTSPMHSTVSRGRSPADAVACRAREGVLAPPWIRNLGTVAHFGSPFFGRPTRHGEVGCLPLFGRYPPTICTTTSRRRPRVSKSSRTICCQVPSVIRPSTMGTVREGPRADARTCACPLSSCQVSSCL